MALKIRTVKKRIQEAGVVHNQQEILHIIHGLSQLTPGELTTELAGDMLLRVTLLREELIRSLREAGHKPEVFDRKARLSFWRKM